MYHYTHAPTKNRILFGCKGTNYPRKNRSNSANSKKALIIREEVVELLVNRGGLKRKTAEDLLTGLRLSDSAFDKLLTGV